MRPTAHNEVTRRMAEHVFIAGGTGFVGVNLANRLADRGGRVVVMGPSGDRPPHLSDDVRVLQGDGRVEGPWQEEAARSRLLINLAGSPIFTRWTTETKKLLRDSRVLTTRNLVAALPPDSSGATLFSTSAVGYYGFREDEELDEQSPPGDDFLARLCRDWESEALVARDKGARVVTVRFGLVLGRGGGVLGRMVPMFKRFLGGPLGSGRQWFSWIHMEDLLGAFSFLMEQPGADGPYNLTSPAPVRNRELAQSLGRVLRRPSFLPAPSLAVRLGLGEFGMVVLKGQRVLPRNLLALGYRFKYPGIDEALADLFK